MTRALRVIVLCPARFVLVLALAACQVACQKPPEKTPAEQEEQTFRTVCARCHGLDGTGGPPDSLGNPGPKNFTDPTFQRSMTDTQIKNAIENGNRAMPAFGAVLAPAQVDLLVAHVRRFGSGEPKRDAP